MASMDGISRSYYSFKPRSGCLV